MLTNITKNKYIRTILTVVVLVALSFGIYLYLLPKKTEAAWYNDNWSYRQTVAVTNSGSNQTHFQIQVTLDTSTLISAGKLQSDCDDLRITDFGGNIIPHWIETGNSSFQCNATTTKIWVKIPSITTSGATIYLYYGNPQGSNIEQGEKVFEFFDEFTGSAIDPDKWTYVNSTGFSVTSGELRGSSTTGRIRSNTVYNDPIVIETMVQNAGTATNGVMSFGFFDSTSNSLGLLEQATDYWYRNDGSWVGPTTYDIINNHRVRISHSDTSATLFIDNGSSTSTQSGITNTLINEYITMGERYDDTQTGEAYDVRWKWIIARKYASTEPSANSPSNEEKAPSPVAYWKLDDGTGTTAQDATSNNFDMTLAAPTATPTWSSDDLCISSKCLTFDGSDDYASVADTNKLDFGTGDFTVSTWVRTSQTSDLRFVYKYNGDTTRGFMLYANGNVANKATFQLWDTGGANQATANSITNINDGRWHHLVGVRSGTTNYLYFDGVLEGTATGATSDVSGSTNMYIGSSSVPNFYLKGSMDEVKIYNYARSVAQIKSEFSSRSNNEDTSAVLGASSQEFLSEGLVGFWKMNDSSGTATDSSGNGLTLTNNNTTPFETGKFGNAGNFNGTSQYFSISDQSVLDLSDKGTFSAWINTANTSANPNFRAILGKDTTDDRAYNFGVKNSEVYAEFYNAIGEGTIKTSSTTFSNSVWNHLVVTFECPSGSTIIKVNFYINGRHVREDTNTWGTSCNLKNSAAEFNIGGRIYPSNREYFSGKIDEVRVYNRIFSPAEVSSLYNFAPGPTSYYDFEDTSTTSILDKSGNGATGTWNGSTTNRYTNGKYGRAGKFASANSDYVNATGANIASLQGTVSAWVYPTAAGTYDILGAGAATNDFRISPGNNLYGFYIAGEYRVSYATDPTLNTWTYVTLTWDQTNGSILYYNGVRVASNSTPPPAFNQTGLQLGRTVTAPTEILNGYLDDVRAYNYARTQKQIVADMNSGHPSVGSPVGSAIAHWKFDEGYSTTAFNSGSVGSSLNGTLNGFSSPATASSGWSQSGKFGKALNFDGSGDYLSVTDSTALASEYITISAWIKVDTWILSAPIINRRTAGNVGGYTLDITNNTGEIIFYAYISGAWRSITTTGWATSTWQHITATYDGSYLRVYRNGLSVGTPEAISGTINNPTTPTVWIGRNVATDTIYHDGAIDELKLYSYALTADEVKLEYNRSSSLILGTLSDTNSVNTSPPQAAASEYCVPGDTVSSSCAAPVARWDFEEKAGQVANDTSGNAITGTFGTSGSPDSNDPSWTTGKVGGGVQIDGVDNHVDAGTSSTLDFSTGFTIEFWVKRDATQLSVDSAIIAKIQAGSPYDGYMFWYNSDTIDLFINNATRANSTTTIAANRWYHVAGVWDGTNVKIYLDGKEDISSAYATAPTSSTRTFLIGAYQAGRYFTGIVDQVRVFNYARSQAQIAWDYNKGAPIAHWKLDECQGTSLYDSSGNGNTGTWNGVSGGSQTAVGTCIGSANTAWKDGATGKYNASLDFDGTDDYINVPTSTIFNFGTGDFAFSAWFKRASAINQRDAIISKDNSTGSARQFIFLILNDITTPSQLRISYFKSGDSEVYLDSVTTFADTNWHHVVGQRKGNSLEIYVDGRLDISGTTSGTHGTMQSTSTDIQIGRRPYSGFTDEMDGQIDDVRVYNYSLTPGQVKILYNQGSSVRFGPSTGSP